MWNAIKPNELHKVFSLFLGERRNVETFFISFFTPLCPKWKAVDTVVSVTSSEWKTTYATFLPALAASKTKSQHVTRASAQLCPTLCDPIRLLYSWEFSSQEYWNGWPCSAPGDLPDPGIKLGSPALQLDFLPGELPGKPQELCKTPQKKNVYFVLQ